MNEKYIGALYLAIAASIWGGMYVVVKVTVAVVPPLELVWMRYAVAGVVLVFTIWRLGYSFRLDKKDIPLIAAIGLIGNVLSIVTQEIGTMYTSAQMGAVITSATPAFMVLFAFFLLKESFTVRKCASILLATVGVLTMIGPVAVQTDEFAGGLSLVIAALTWALMSVLLKRVPGKYPQVVTTTYAIIIAFIVLTPPVLFHLPHLDVGQMARPEIWGGILYLGMISTALAFFLWNRGLQLMDASSGGLFFFFQPIVGAVLGWLLLGEEMGMRSFIGILCIFAGVYTVLRQKE
ncbi:MAG: DMT family transporter [Bacillota bacterium]|uniref:EamA family transporter n=1 Tax=Bacillus pumilus TaxID=1408 RepID=A0A2G8IPS7_BACPU|nr:MULTISPECIES: DMT family transporter [Bacillus]MED1750740.1 DMT family transporter [Bacillus zhangzhouensis]PIK25525.1 EamA family transporter [Bacillus pumilus]